MQILIIGNGGREHALAWKVKQSPLVSKVYVAPGNAGTALEDGIENVPIAASDIDKLLIFARDHQIALTIVGPEQPLAAGIVDQFTAQGLACFGPTQAAAQLEASKAYSKDFMLRHGIPTARYASFTDLTAAKNYAQEQSFPLVIKADGLAAGKGVVIAQDLPQALQTLEDMLADQSLGSAGARVVIEEFISGEEASFIVMADGEFALPLATSQDHKALNNGDLGPNTGGMGAYSPAPLVTADLQEQIMQQVIYPTLKGMAEEGHPYTGFLYAGLMITANQEIKVLEFNCRLGDPETQAILLRLKSDLVVACQAALAKKLATIELDWDNRYALGVVMAAGGYPNKVITGDRIEGLPIQENNGSKIFHAGTSLENANVKTAGGRVLCVTALGETVQAAQERAYQITQNIHWPNHYYRTDIGHRAIAREI